MIWSSQQYVTDGLAAGIDPAVLEAAASTIENVLGPHPELPPLLSLNHLAKRSQTNFEKLRSVIAGNAGHYRHFRIRKRAGGHRAISIPEPMLMDLQRWIAVHILNARPVHHCSFAFSPKASILKCAARHTGARWLIKLDVAGFFGSISEIQVYRVFREMGYQPLIAFELARLTTFAPPASIRYQRTEWQARAHGSPISTYKRSRLGYLPQGAPTSPMLSNLVMLKIDSELEKLANDAGLRYTRYSDDLTFSTRSEFNRTAAVELVRRAAAILRRIGLQVNDRKTVISPPGGRKIVLGLLVDGPNPRLSRKFHAMLRQHLYYLETRGSIEHAKARNFETVSGLYRHIRGLIDFANMIEPDYARDMLKRLQVVEWANPDMI